MAVGVLGSADGRVLIARRPAHVHQGGKWEFPGGKIRPHEDPEDALRRELREELGIVIRRARPMLRVDHPYEDKRVLLDVWRVLAYEGDPAGKEGQPVKWVPHHELHRYEFPQANKPILRALSLPPVYAISQAGELGYDVFLERLKTALEKGLRLVQLREPLMEPAAYHALAEEVLELCHEHGARLLINDEPAAAVRHGADGVHLNSARLLACNERPLPGDRLVAASCHNENELKKAAAIAADFALLSPVRRTRSHPAAEPLGWERFGVLAAGAGLPVYALGGMGPADLEAARYHGAHGVAMMREAWSRSGVEVSPRHAGIPTACGPDS